MRHVLSVEYLSTLTFAEFCLCLLHLQHQIASYLKRKHKHTRITHTQTHFNPTISCQNIRQKPTEMCQNQWQTSGAKFNDLTIIWLSGLSTRISCPVVWKWQQLWILFFFLWVQWNDKSFYPNIGNTVSIWMGLYETKYLKTSLRRFHFKRVLRLCSIKMVV